MLAQAIDLAEAGDRDQAYALARSAYLSHFELVEIPLRSAREPGAHLQRRGGLR